MTAVARATVVELVGVTRRYGSGATAVPAVIDTSISIWERDQVAVVGPSGSGKTTLLSLMGLIERPDEGVINFLESPTHSKSEDQRADLRRAHVGLVFQVFHLIPALTALDNVLIPLVPYRPHHEIEPRARDLLQRIGLGERLNHRPAQLSGGEQQRVAIARALINEPRLVLADEPTGNLDSNTGDRVIELLLGLQKEAGFALVVATHDDRFAARLGRMVRLSDGRIV